MIYKIERHRYDSFNGGITIDDIEYDIKTRPWWRFWRWDYVMSFEKEEWAVNWVEFQKFALENKWKIVKRYYDDYCYDETNEYFVVFRRPKWRFFWWTYMAKFNTREEAEKLVDYYKGKI